MADLKKLLVIVRTANCDNFKLTYVTGDTDVAHVGQTGGPKEWDGTTLPTPDTGYVLGHAFDVTVGETTTHYYTQRKPDYDGKVVFLEKTQEIFTQGNLYGGGADIAQIKKILKGFETEGSVKDAIDAVKANLTSLDFNYDDTTKHLNLSYTDGGTASVLTYVNVADNKDAFVDANNSYLTNVKGVKSYVTDQIGQLSGGMRYNGNVITETSGEKVIGYFPWNATTHSVKCGDTAIVATDFVVSDDDTKTIESGDMLIGKYPYEIKQNTLVTIKENKAACSAIGDGYVKSTEGGVTTIEYIVALNGSEEVFIEYELQSGESIVDNHVTIWTNTNGILISSYALAFITVIERENDNMVTAPSKFNDADRIILSYNGNRDITATAYTISAAAITDAGSNTVLPTQNVVAAYAANAATTAVQALDVTAYNLKNSYMAVTYAQTDGIVTLSNLSTYITSVTFADGKLTVGTDNGLLDKADADAINSYIAYVGNLVDSLDESYTTVSGKAQQLTAATPATYYINVEAVNTGNDHEYTVSAYLKTLGSAVGMYYSGGEWHAAGGTVTQDGLVTAYDVAYEIVSDEKVIAAALNNHETRIKNCEAYKPADGTASATNNGVYTYTYTSAGTITTAYTKITGATVTAGGTTGARTLSYGTGEGQYTLTADALTAISTYAYNVAADAAGAISTKIVYTYAATNTGVGLEISYESGVAGSYIYTTFDAAHAVAYTIGTTTYSVADVATAVYDPWETFA